MKDAATVLGDALELDVRARAKLAKELIASLDREDADAETLWQDEIRARLASVDDGTAKLSDWDDVYARLVAAAAPVPDWHKEELDRRAAAADADPSAFVSWPEAKARILGSK